MKIITIINQKGGVGKSTTAQALAVGLKKINKKILLMDLDPQSNLSYISNADTNNHNILNVLTNEMDINNSIQKTNIIDIISASKGLSVADNLFTNTGKEFKLKEAIENINYKYNYIIIDTPPALNILTVNALTCTNYIIIPAQADILSLQGIGQLNDTINTIKKYTNKDLKILGILLTRYSDRTILTKEVTKMAENIASSINTYLYKTKIREAIAIKEAQIKRQDIYSYAKNSKCAKDYENFIKETLNRLKEIK